MQLVTRQQLHAQKYGTDIVVLGAGEKLRIQTWDAVNGIVDVLAEVEVPSGKSWSVSIIVDATETDA